MNKVSNLYNNNSTTKVTSSKLASGKDKLEISQMGKDYQVAKQAVSQTSDIREDKVNEIKARITSGTYDITAKDVASKLVDSYFDTSI